MSNSLLNRTIKSAALVLVSALAFSATAAEYNVQVNIPYADESKIASNVRMECTTLGTKLSDFVVQYAKKKGIKVNQVEKIDPSAPGRNLVIEITEAVSMGAAGIGHQKYMNASGELFIDGMSKSKQHYSRQSMGGMFGAYKGSCSVLGRNTKVLGKDFSVWLSQVDVEFE